jgi:hypothetical protein
LSIYLPFVENQGPCALWFTLSGDVISRVLRELELSWKKHNNLSFISTPFSPEYSNTISFIPL